MAATKSGVDERLLVKAAQQDLTRFGELYEIHFERIYAFIACRVRDRGLTEDLTSEVFHKALASLPAYEWRGTPFAAWLMKIAANALADQWKRSAREVRNKGEMPESGVEPDTEAVERRAQLFRLVKRLPTAQRHVIFGRFVEQKSILEIAQALGKSEGAVKQLQLRALQTLRRQMEGAHA
ncbi:MAG TPA: sigma-70 family RNA polymerase sigma factor [Bryobacteraceae bacterium]|jgi:RNA polymerase sigma-70 factor (ECF subfamily)